MAGRVVWACRSRAGFFEDKRFAPGAFYRGCRFNCRRREQCPLYMAAPLLVYLSCRSHLADCPVHHLHGADGLDGAAIEKKYPVLSGDDCRRGDLFPDCRFFRVVCRPPTDLSHVLPADDFCSPGTFRPFSLCMGLWSQLAGDAGQLDCAANCAGCCRAHGKNS